MSDPAAPPVEAIEPTLFQYVIEEAAELSGDPQEINDELRGTDRLPVFLENFVAQFAANVLGVRIQGLSEAALEDWVEERQQLAAKPGTEAAQRLMFSLERAFTLVAELSYSSSPTALADFRTAYVPEVLDRVVEWASSWDQATPALIAAARGAQDAYAKAVG